MQEIRYGNVDLAIPYGSATLLYLRILPIPMAQVLCKPNLFDSCRKYSTNRLIFMQNKANFQKSQMDIKLNISKDYEKNIALDIWWKQTQSKPISRQKIDVREQRTNYGSLPAGGGTEDSLSSGHGEHLWHAPYPGSYWTSFWHYSH